MSVRVNPGLAQDLRRFGGDTVNKCFNCGNCTAACSLSKDDTTFPRKFIRYMQLGLQDKMAASPDPWLCYYCGTCSDTCPREAEPGELMMASRRWLTAKYDWTGLARLMYRSELWEVLMLVLVAGVVLLLFTVPDNFGFRLLAQHPEARSAMMIQYFAPKEIVHVGDLILAAGLAFFLFTNAGHMFVLIMRGTKFNLWHYISEFKQLILHVITQKRWGECDNDVRKHWLRHVALVTGYGTMLLLVVVFLPWFQVEDRGFHFTSLLGYYSTLVLLGTTIWIIFDRLGKKDQIHKYSHLSDWLFPILLFVVSLTGILLHLFRLAGWPMATYVIYVIHMMLAVSMLAVEVPFGKWSHLLYRPLAVYLSGVKERAGGVASAVPSPALRELIWRNANK
jgi:heterodisulfide reductase subunit C